VSDPTVRVPFADFRAQLAPLRAEIDAALGRVLDSGWFILGPEVGGLEQELCAWSGAREAVAVGNGTEALQLALEAAGIGPGDEVVTTPLTAAFTALAIVRSGAEPVFADVEGDSLNLDADAVERAVTSRTRAILPVHLYGQPADLVRLSAVAERHGLLLIEDGCQAHGARIQGRRIGSRGTVALSFYPTKNLGALGDGGAILTEDAALAERLRELRNGGQRRRYEHVRLGMNSRLDELQAAILRVKLRHLDGWVERRRVLAGLYLEALDGTPLSLPREAGDRQSAYHLFAVRHSGRDALAQALRERGIETLVHYPLPVHLQPAFEGYSRGAGQCPVAEAAATEVLSLPLYPEMTEEALRAVVSATRAALG
jgi:dTDP-3-amino-3,4,6-trideoxy-alpha-D-glucose transaminase